MCALEREEGVAESADAGQTSARAAGAVKTATQIEVAPGQDLNDAQSPHLHVTGHGFAAGISCAGIHHDVAGEEVGRRSPPGTVFIERDDIPASRDQRDIRRGKVLEIQREIGRIASGDNAHPLARKKLQAEDVAAGGVETQRIGRPDAQEVGGMQSGFDS